MQYFVSVIHDAPSLATPSEAAAIDVFNERLQARGHWVFAVGLGAPSTATVIDDRGDEVVITDGPYVETKEWLGGLTVVDVADEETARMWAGKIAEACGWPQEVRRFGRAPGDDCATGGLGQLPPPRGLVFRACHRTQFLPTERKECKGRRLWA